MRGEQVDGLHTDTRVIVPQQNIRERTADGGIPGPGFRPSIAFRRTPALGS